MFTQNICSLCSFEISAVKIKWERQVIVSHMWKLLIALPCASALTLLWLFSEYIRETLKWSSQKGHFLMIRKNTAMYVCMCQKCISVHICIYIRNIQLHERTFQILIIAKFCYLIKTQILIWNYNSLALFYVCILRYVALLTGDKMLYQQQKIP